MKNFLREIDFEMDVKQIIIIAFTIVLTSCGKSEETIPTSKPNIIIILVDDLGYNDLKIGHTPNIDRLFNDGLVFNNFHTNASCTPSRVSLLTGMYPQHFRLEKPIKIDESELDIGLEQNATTLFEYLKKWDYTTALFGKWHLGWKNKYSPLKQGFDQWIGFKSGNIDYHSKIDNAGNYDWFKNDTIYREEGYVTRLIVEHANRFIDQNTGSPFSIYLPFSSPHWPIQGPNDPPQRFEGGTPDQWNVMIEKSSYQQMIESLDHSIGLVLTKLESTGILDNTIIFFSSDNGMWSRLENNNISTNAPLRNYKGSLFEGGVLCPSVFYWKGSIQKGQSNQLSHLVDVLPTILGVIGVEPTYTDGIDLLNEKLIPPRNIYQRIPSSYDPELSLTQENWKLVMKGNGDEFLFNLDDDIEEKINLKDAKSSKFNSMKEELIEWNNRW